MNNHILITFKILPFVTLVYTFYMLYETLGIIHDIGQNYIFFLFLVFQVYINWLTILSVGANCVVNEGRETSKVDDNSVKVNLLNNEEKPLNMHHSACAGLNNNANYIGKLPKKGERSSAEEDFNVDTNVVWYCSRCCQQSSEKCYHCPVCNKCVFQRDHHCFFLGVCITKQNLKHFVVLLLYGSITAFYATYLLCEAMNFFEGVLKDWKIVLIHLFPVAFVQYLGGEFTLQNLIRVAALDLTVSLGIFMFVFYLNYMYLILSGKILHRLKRRGFQPVQRVVSEGMCTNFSLIFGSCGALNFLIPVGFAHNVLKIHLQ